MVSTARSFLAFSLRDVVLTYGRRTVLANGALPGPFIQGNKVSAISEFTPMTVSLTRLFQNDQFS